MQHTNVLLAPTSTAGSAILLLLLLGRQIILDLTLTGIEGQSRTSDRLSDRPLQFRHEQKTTKYSRIVDESGL